MALTIYFLSLLFLMMPLFCTATLTDNGGEITLSFTLSSYQVLENNGPAQPVLRLSRPVDCCSTISVWVYVEDIEAIQGSDYTSDSHMQVLFPGGITTTKFDVRMVDNMILENTERFKVSIDPLSLPFGVVLGDITSAEVNIIDEDETQVSFDKSTYAVNEGDGNVELTLQLTKPIPFINNTLQLVIGEDVTTTTCDYGSRVHTVPIPTNTTTFTYDVIINDDDLYEIDETFKLQIVASSLHRQIKRVQPHTTTVTIFNDEEPICVTLTTQPTIDEDAGVLKVNLNLDKPSPCCLRVYVETIDVMAEGEGVDYGAGGDNRQYEVIFPAGTNCSSVEIPIIDDAVSEQDEEFTVKIMEESLPFGVILGDNTMADVMIIDNDIYLMFSNSEYEGYEHDGMLCVTVTHDKPALFDTLVQIIESRGTATDGRDYEEGPYNVIIPKGQMSVDYCINITNDEELEMDEAFSISINNETAVAQGVVLMDPHEAIRVIILDDEYTFCFDLPSYAVEEDDGVLVMTLTLSRSLPFEISVKFLYTNITATGNHSVGRTDIDYYTAKVFPNFDTIPAYERHYTLNIKIVPDRILENNELFKVTARPQHMPFGQPECSVDVIIKDDDDILLNFESRSYEVSDKNLADEPVIWIRYPEVYLAMKMFPIIIDVEITNITATEIIDFDRMYYNHQIFNDLVKTIKLPVRAIDDDIAETDEIYNLTIKILSAHNRVGTGENTTTTMTIYNDDTAYLSFDGTSSLRFDRKVELLADALVNITYTDGQHNMTTITQRQALNREKIPLPVFQAAIDKIDVYFPPGYNSTKIPTVVTKDPKIRFP